MLITMIAVLWLGVMISFFMIVRDQKKKEAAFLYRMKELEDSFEKMKSEGFEKASSRMKAVNNIATELLEVMQDKAEDISRLIVIANEKLVAVERAKIVGFSDSEKQDMSLSLSERHTIESLKKRRAS